jgi:hypothetical protein
MLDVIISWKNRNFATGIDIDELRNVTELTKLYMFVVK